jgi:hypothetical protein
MEQVYAIQWGPVNSPSATPASTNNINYMDDGTTSGYQGIPPILFFCCNTSTIESLLYYNII